MVLRDININSFLRSASFSLLLLLGSCQQSPADNTVQAADNQKAGLPAALDIQLQTMRAELQTAMESMSGITQTAQELHMSGGNGKTDGNTENIDAVFEKSGAVLGAMFILKGSIDAVEQYFNQGILDQKKAKEMLDKLSVSLKSYQSDIAGYQEALDGVTPPKTEKK